VGDCLGLEATKFGMKRMLEVGWRWVGVANWWKGKRQKGREWRK